MTTARVSSATTAHVHRTDYGVKTELTVELSCFNYSHYWIVQLQYELTNLPRG